jgi:hypothetical protein
MHSREMPDRSMELMALEFSKLKFVDLGCGDKYNN